VATPKTLVLQQRVKNACREIQVKPGFFYVCAPLCDKKLKDVLKCMRTTENIYRNHRNIARISADSFFGHTSIL
jgi:hypothetical protein